MKTFEKSTRVDHISQSPKSMLSPLPRTGVSEFGKASISRAGWQSLSARVNWIRLDASHWRTVCDLI